MRGEVRENWRKSGDFALLPPPRPSPQGELTGVCLLCPTSRVIPNGAQWRVEPCSRNLEHSPAKSASLDSANPVRRCARNDICIPLSAREREWSERRLFPLLGEGVECDTGRIRFPLLGERVRVRGNLQRKGDQPLTPALSPGRGGGRREEAARLPLHPNYETNSQGEGVRHVKRETVRHDR